MRQRQQGQIRSRRLRRRSPAGVFLMLVIAMTWMIDASAQSKGGSATAGGGSESTGGGSESTGGGSESTGGGSESTSSTSTGARVQTPPVRVDTLRVRHPRRLQIRRPAPNRARHSMDIEIDEMRQHPSLAAFRQQLGRRDFDAAQRSLESVRDTVRREPVLREVAGFDLIELDLFRGEFETAREAYQVYATTNKRGYLANDAIARMFLIDDNSDFNRSPLRLYTESEYLVRVGRVDSAVATCLMAIERYPETALRDDLYLQLGDLTTLADDSAPAVTYYRAIIDSETESPLAPMAQMRIGMYYAEIERDIPSAIEAYEEVLVRYPDSLEAPEARKILEKLRRRT